MPSASQTEVLLLHHDHHAKLAPADGFAPPTFRLTAGGSTIELRGNGKWSARSDLHAQGCLILSQVGLLFPVNHAPEIGVPDRLRSGDLLHERQACFLDYTTGTKSAYESVKYESASDVRSHH